MTEAVVASKAGTCGARKRSGPGECGRPAGWGTDHPGTGRCKLHGGSTTSHRRAAFRAEAVRDGIAHLGLSIEVEPAEAMMALIWEAAANVSLYRDMASKLGLAVYERTFHVSGMATGEAKPHVLVAMYDAERDRLAKLSEKALVLGLREREVRVAEQQGQLLADLFRSLIADPELGLSVTQQQMAPGLVRKHLAIVRGAAA